MDDKSFENGFSLPELLIGMAILAGATLGASKVMEMMAKSARDAEIRTELKVRYAALDKDITDNMSSLSDVEFNREFSFYSSGNNLNRVGIVDPDDLADPEYIKSAWLQKIGNNGVYSSFSFIKKSKGNTPLRKRYQRFFAVCIPIEDALTFYDEEWNTEKLTTITHYPFVKNNNGRMSIHCCTQDDPNCDDPSANPISNSADYVVKIIRNDIIHVYEPDNIQTPIDQPDQVSEIVKLIPPKGNINSITGGGFFFSHRNQNISQGNQLFGYYFVYYSDCLSKRVRALGAMVDNCKGSVKLEHKIRMFQINSTMGGGANDVGNIGW